MLMDRFFLFFRPTKPDEAMIVLDGETASLTFDSVGFNVFVRWAVCGDARWFDDVLVIRLDPQSVTKRKDGRLELFKKTSKFRSRQGEASDDVSA